MSQIQGSSLSRADVASCSLAVGGGITDDVAVTLRRLAGIFDTNRGNKSASGCTTALTAFGSREAVFQCNRCSTSGDGRQYKTMDGVSKPKKYWY